MISNIAVPFFIRLRYREPFHINRDVSQVEIQGNEIRTVSSALEGDWREKRTTHDNANYNAYTLMNLRLLLNSYNY